MDRILNPFRKKAPDAQRAEPPDSASAHDPWAAKAPTFQQASAQAHSVQCVLVDLRKLAPQDAAVFPLISEAQRQVHQLRDIVSGLPPESRDVWIL